MKKHLISLGLTALLSLMLVQPVLSQPGILEQYIREGLQQNLGIQQQQLEVEQKQLGARRARANYLPEVDFAATYLLADGGRMIRFPVGDLLNPVYNTLNDMVDGTPFPRDLENVEEQFLPNNFHDTRIRVRQPLFNTNIHYGARIAESEIAIQEAQLGVRQAEILRDVSVAYYQHMQTRALIEIYDSTQVLLEELLRFNEKLVRYDKATRDVISSVEFELAELAGDRAEAVLQRERSKAYFNQLLHRPLEEAIIVDSAARQLPDRPAATSGTLRTRSLQNRSELQQLEKAIATNDLLTELRRKDRLPQLGLELNAGFQGFGYDFNGEQSYYSLGFSLNWNLFGGQRKQLRIQEAEVEQLQTRTRYEEAREQVQVQVIQAYYDLQAAWEKYEARGAALKSARESFRIIGKRYENQQVLLVELLDARTRYTNAQIQSAIARYDIKIKEAELLRAVGSQQ